MDFFSKLSIAQASLLIAVAALLGPITWSIAGYGLSKRSKKLKKLRKEINLLNKQLHNAKNNALVYKNRSDDLSSRLVKENGPGSTLISSVNKMRDILEDMRVQISADRATLYVPVFNKRNMFVGIVAIITVPEDVIQIIFHDRVIAAKDAEAFRCFINKQVHRHKAEKNSFSHDFSTDEFITGSLLTDVIFSNSLEKEEKPKAVIQFINGITQTRTVVEFPPNAEDVIKKNKDKLLGHIDTLDTSIKSLRHLGIHLNDEVYRGTILSFDITNSSSFLMDETKVSLARDIIREISTVIIGVCIAKQGTVLAFSGDGYIVSFSSTNEDVDTQLSSNRALSSAIEIRQFFQKIQERYDAKIGAIGVDPIFCRIALTTGVLHPIQISEPGFSHYNVFGKTISSARYLCDTASRDKNIIIADSATVAELVGEYEWEIIPQELLSSKAIKQKILAYEFLDMSEH